MLSNLMSVKKSLNLIFICGMLIFISDASAQTDYKLFPDEEKVVTQIEKNKEKSPLLLWQLGSIRLKHAAGLYKNWGRNKQAEDFQKALIYAKSSTELSRDNDEAWLLLGMLYSEMKATPEAMEKAADALIHAVDINPANGRAQLLLAQVLMEQGRYWSAIEQYKILIEESEAMRTPGVLSLLTFCYVADGRIQAGIDYVSKAPEITQGDSTEKLRWRDWKTINQAVLERAQGKREHAIDFLKLIFFYHDDALTVENKTDEYAKHLITLWEKEAENEKAN
jgi:tetratricopeptide (TPR) repeat protein